LAPIALVAVLGFGFASAHASAPGNTQRPPLGPPVHVDDFAAFIANHRIVTAIDVNPKNPDLVLLTVDTETRRRRLFHIPQLEEVLGADGDVAWVSAGTDHPGSLIQQVDLNTGAVVGTLDLVQQLDPDIQEPDTQLFASDAGVWLLVSDRGIAFNHLVRIDPKTTTIAARVDLDTDYDELINVTSSTGWVVGTDSTTNKPVTRAFDPISLALGPVRNGDWPGWDCVGSPSDEHYVWVGTGQELTAHDRTTCKLVKRISLAHTLARGTTVGDMALHNDTLWVTVDRSHGDSDSAPVPDHVELLAIRPSDGRVLGRYPIPGAGHDASKPQLVEGHNQIWVWLHNQMERINTEPR
jgi:hypothetical protein